MHQTPILIAPPTAHPIHWPDTPEPAWFRAELEKFLPYPPTGKTTPTPTGGNIHRARLWYYALSAAVVDALENLPEDASAAQVIQAVQTAVNTDLHDDSPMMKPISAWTRLTVFTHALTAPAQLEAAARRARQ